MKERKLGLLGTKVGMTSIFDEGGRQVGVTVLALGPCIVLGKRTPQRDSYSALILGFGAVRQDKVNMAAKGQLEGVGGIDGARKNLMELRVPETLAAKFEVGQSISVADLGLKAGDLVDVMGQSKGKGFQGVMKRYHFKGFRATHGTHESFRGPGSIGCRKWPGRVYKGRKMPGHMGDKRVTTQNMEVVAVRAEDNVLLVNGAVPGCKNGMVMVRPAIKFNHIVEAKSA